MKKGKRTPMTSIESNNKLEADGTKAALIRRLHDLLHLHAANGITPTEAGEILGIHKNTLSPRFAELEARNLAKRKRGDLIQVGEIRKLVKRRAGDTGRLVQVWIPTGRSWEQQTDPPDKIREDKDAIIKRTREERDTAVEACREIMRAIAATSRNGWHPDPEVDQDNWNEDAHIEVTITVRDCRGLKRVLLAAEDRAN